MSIAKAVAAWFDKVTGRAELCARNDRLVCANNRLGKEILDLRAKLKKAKPKTVVAEKRAARSDVKAYNAHIQSQRQHFLVKALAKHLPKEVFAAECEKINQMTDEQIEAMK